MCNFLCKILNTYFSAIDSDVTVKLKSIHKLLNIKKIPTKNIKCLLTSQDSQNDPPNQTKLTSSSPFQIVPLSSLNKRSKENPPFITEHITLFDKKALILRLYFNTAPVSQEKENRHRKKCISQHIKCLLSFRAFEINFVRYFFFPQLNVHIIIVIKNGYMATRKK